MTYKENQSPNLQSKLSVREEVSPGLFDKSLKSRKDSDLQPKYQPSKSLVDNSLSRFGMTQDLDFDDEDWLPGAIRCKERKHTKFQGNRKIQTVKRIFTMKDGSIEIVEDRVVEKLP